MLKRWLVALGAFLVAAGVLLPPLAADVDFFFTKRFEMLTWKPIQGWAAVLAGGKPLQFYLLFCAVVAVLLLWVMFTGSYLKYRSDMRRITPDIETPCADGQGQFGTARWLPREKFRKYFGVWKIPAKDPGFQALLEAGKADREEIENADIQID